MRFVKSKASQWHILHSIRVGEAKQWLREEKKYSDDLRPYGIVLTVDGFIFSEQSELKMFEGERPKGRMCTGCSTVINAVAKTTEVG